jgi:SAM-dependent methyltransferase
VTEAFGMAYANAYDALYAEKDYDAECDLLEKVFAEPGRTVRSVLDLGCGTGAHSSRLAERGYDVVGVDISNAMLGIARRHEHPGSGRVEYVLGDIRSVQLGRQFDAVICMFAVLGYQTTDDDVGRALETVRHHLSPDGPFVFDVWFGPAVESIGPSRRSKVVATDDGEIERRASATIDRNAHLCTVRYQLITRQRGMPEVATDEVHRMRYFFPDELAECLERADLRLSGLAPLPETTAPIDSTTWNVVATARG